MCIGRYILCVKIYLSKAVYDFYEICYIGTYGDEKSMWLGVTDYKNSFSLFLC